MPCCSASSSFSGLLSALFLMSSLLCPPLASASLVLGPFVRFGSLASGFSSLFSGPGLLSPLPARSGFFSVGFFSALFSGSGLLSPLPVRSPVLSALLLRLSSRLLSPCKSPVLPALISALFSALLSGWALRRRASFTISCSELGLDLGVGVSELGGGPLAARYKQFRVQGFGFCCLTQRTDHFLLFPTPPLHPERPSTAKRRPR